MRGEGHGRGGEVGEGRGVEGGRGGQALERERDAGGARIKREKGRLG
jgi:hypothetical protein